MAAAMAKTVRAVARIENRSLIDARQKRIGTRVKYVMAVLA
jgi:hypothetical protein